MPKNNSKRITYWTNIAINWVGRRVRPSQPQITPCKQRGLPLRRTWGGK